MRPPWPPSDRKSNYPVVQILQATSLNHYWIDDTVEYEAVVKQGFTEIRSSAHTFEKTEPLDYRSPPADKSNMARYLFGGVLQMLGNTGSVPI
jgi:type III restriction enzyme